MNILLTVRRTADATAPVTGTFPVEVSYARTVSADDAELQAR
jgi:hypothetical protein